MEHELKTKFEHFSREQLRIMWDNIGEDDFFGPYDIAEIHAWMNVIGDGDYCAV